MHETSFLKKSFPVCLFRKLITKEEARKLVAEGRRFEGMLSVKEKNYSENMFMNNSFEEVENSVSFEVSKVSFTLNQQNDAQSFCSVSSHA